MRQGDKGISWTDATWNPVTGCTPVSAGCEHCYAGRYARRGIGDFRASRKPIPGGSANITRSFSEVHCHPDRLELPMHWRKPRRIFVCSIGDLFHEQVPDGFINGVIGTIATATQHIFQILTKRPRRMLEFFRHLEFAFPHQKPLPNLWLGVTAENQDMADERIPILEETPAALRFVSFEPLLGQIYLRDLRTLKIDWVIAGGENGPGARPCHPDWVRSLRDQAISAGVAFHFKGWGEYAPDLERYCGIDAPKRVGKKAAGRLLDGREWLEFPEAKEFRK